MRFFNQGWAKALIAAWLIIGHGLLALAAPPTGSYLLQRPLGDAAQGTSDITPDQCNFAPVTGAAISQFFTSNNCTIAGVTGAVSFVVTGPTGTQAVVNGSAAGRSGTVSPGQTLAIQTRSSNKPATSVSGHVQIGSMSASFDVTTAAPGGSNTAPVWVSPAAGALSSQTAGSAIAPIVLTGSDADAHSLSFSVSGGALPTGLSVVGTSSTTAEIQGTPSAVGSYNFTLRINDGNGGTADRAFSMTINPAPNLGPPSWQAPTPAEMAGFNFVATQAIAAIEFSATDPDTPITYSALDVLPTGLSFNPVTRQITGTPSSASATANYRIRATDGHSSPQNATRTISITVAAADDTPNAFDFTDNTGVATSTLIESNTVTINGINVAAAVSISGVPGAQFRIAGGAWVSSGSISNGQSLQLRMTSSGSGGTTLTATVNVGSGSDTWATITSGGASGICFDPGTIGSFTNAPPNTWMVSPVYTVKAGCTGGKRVPDGGGMGLMCGVLTGSTGYEWKINGGAWSSSEPATFSAGATFQIRVRGDGTGAGAGITCSYYVPGTSEFDPVEDISWQGTVSSSAGDQTPSAFDFTDLINQAQNTVVTSNSVTIAGIDRAVNVTLSGESSTEFKIGSYGWSREGTIMNGQSLQLRMTTANAAGTTRTATVNVGLGSDTWATTTSGTAGQCLDSTAFSNVTNAQIGQTVYSNIYTIKSGCPGATIGSPCINISGVVAWSRNGGAWGTSDMDIAANDTLQLRVTTDSTNNGFGCEYFISGGGQEDYLWMVDVDGSSDTTPAAFDFTDLTNQVKNVQVTSNIVTISGITAATNVSLSGEASTRLSINGGGWVSNGTIQNGQSLQLRMTTANANSTARTATVTVGTASDSWATTTAGNNAPVWGAYPPNGVGFPPQPYVQGAAIEDIILEATDADNDDISYTLHSGSLPAGLSLVTLDNKRAAITGTPTTAGAPTTAVIRANDGNGGTADRSVFIATTNGASACAYTIPTVINATPGARQTWDFVPASLFPSSIYGPGSPTIQMRIPMVGSELTYTSFGPPGATWRLAATAPAAGQTIYVTFKCNNTLNTWEISSAGTAGDSNPDAFSFTNQTGVATSSMITSNSVTPTGYDADASVSVTGTGSPQVSINGGAWATSGTITPGQTIRVRLTSASTGGTMRSATVTIGTTNSSAWQVTTVAPDTTPDQFTFNDQSNAALNTLISSNIITPTGYSSAASASVSGSGSPEISINGGAWATSGTISPGQTIRVRLTSASTNSTARSATVTIDSVSDIWSVTTGSGACLEFPNVLNAPTSSWVESAVATIPPACSFLLSIYLTGDPVTKEYRVNGGAWTASGVTTPVAVGDTVQLRTQTPAPVGNYTSCVMGNRTPMPPLYNVTCWTVDTN